MKLRHMILVGSLMTLGWAWARRTAPDRGMTYRFGFERAAEGIVSVEATLAVTDAPNSFRALLPDAAFGMSGLSAFDELGRELAVTLQSTTETGAAGSAKRFSRVVVSPGQARSIRLRYGVAPGTYLPPSGDKEIRQCGRVSDRGCVLSLANLLLVPEGPATELRLEADVPRSWGTLVPLPPVSSSVDRTSLWETSLVAGEYGGDGVFELAPGVVAQLGRGCGADLIDAMRETAQAVAEVLGAPREPIEVIVPPVEVGSAAAPPVELPAASRACVVDMRGSDPGSLRRFVTRLLPAWWGRSPLELELDADPDAWFALGVREYLAYVLPSRVGLVERDPSLAIENSWVSQPGLRGIDVRLETDRSRPSQYARRLVPMALLRELDLSLPGELSTYLRGYEGHGFPPLLETGPAAGTFRDFLTARIDGGDRKLSFESEWELPWTPPPIEHDRGRAIERMVNFAFTADTSGFLETRGCKAGQAGGIARRASVLREWRAADPQLVVIDLGCFSAVSPAEAVLDPSAVEEQALYPILMQELGYDAVVLGPDELYSGFARRLLGGGDEVGGIAWLGGGVEVAGQPLGSKFVVVEREGLEIGIVGYTELLENAHKRQAQETNMASVTFPEAPELEVLRQLRPRVDLLVVAGRMRPASLRMLAEADLGVDLVLSASHAVVIEAQARGFVGTTAVAFDQMSYLGIQRETLFLSAEGRVLSSRSSGMKLGSEIPDDPSIRARLDEFYASSAVANAKVKPLFQGHPWHQASYVGSESCASCHVEQYRSWKGTSHSTAMKTLVNERRERNPSCVQCHVVGLGTATGYSIAKPTPALGAVGCENCHGAGGAHAQMPTRDNIRLTPEPSTCVTCHDAKHSEAFEERFEDAWRQIVHR